MGHRHHIQDSRAKPQILIRNLEPESPTRNPKSDTRNPNPNPIPETRNPKPEIRNSKPKTVNGSPTSCLRPRSGTRNPHPKPETRKRHPKPGIRNPILYTVPETQHPERVDVSMSKIVSPAPSLPLTLSIESTSVCGKARLLASKHSQTCRG